MYFIVFGSSIATVPLRRLQREQLGRRMIGALLAERRVLGAAHRRGEPDPALLVDHRVVVVDLGVPDLLVAPVGRRRQRLERRGVARSERERHVRIAHRRVEFGDAVLHRIENGNDVGAYSGEPNSGP